MATLTEVKTMPEGIAEAIAENETDSLFDSGFCDVCKIEVDDLIPDPESRMVCGGCR